MLVASGQFLQEADDGAYACAAGTVGVFAPGVLDEGGAGDVEVGPALPVVLVDKFAQEHPGGNGSAVAGVGDVADVGDLAFEGLAQEAVEIELGCHLSGEGVGGVEDALGGLGGEAHDAGGVLAHTHDAGAREGGHVEEVVGADLLLGVAEYVGEHQAPFGVGVAHFDGLAVFGPQDVVGLVGVAADHVLHCADEAMDLHGQVQLGDGLEDPQHGGSAAFVGLHGHHVVGGFEAKPAAIVGEPLAHQADGGDGVFGGVAQVNQPRFMAAGSGDGQQSVHPLALHLFGPEDLDGEFVPLGQLHGDLCHDFGVAVVGGGVDDVTDEVGGLGADDRLVDGPLGGGDIQGEAVVLL